MSEALNKFESSLKPEHKSNYESGLKEKGREFNIVNGPKVFYRFVGRNEELKENAVYGPWWFSAKTFQSFVNHSKAIQVDFSKFCRARLALPNAWNSKEHLYEIRIPEGSEVEAISGIGRGQYMSALDLSKMTAEEKREFESMKNKVIFIGGDEQYYFRPDDIKQFSVSKITMPL